MTYIHKLGAQQDETDGELLLLGEAGSGKTTLLLHLARTLLDRAEADEHLPMPIVFLLSSWAQKQEPLAHWLVEELKVRYQVQRQVAQDWINTNQVLPLLDGLDEVTQEVRDACTQAITAYSTRYANQTGTPLVICCRSDDYQTLSTPLSLQYAVSILPLSDEQVDNYLSSAQGHLEGFRYLLHIDANFATFARRPLMLNIIVLAFQGKRLVNFPSQNNFPSTTQEQILRIIFATYVTRMLSRRGPLLQWTEEQFLHWLIYIAKQMYRQQQTIFSLENIQPDWLPSWQQRLYLWGLRLTFALISGLVFGLISGLVFGLLTGPLAGLIFGLLGWLIFGFWQYGGKIRPAELISWQWKDIHKFLLSGLVFGLVSGLIFGLIFGLINGLVFGLVFGLAVGLINGLFPNQQIERTHFSPNEGIRHSGKNGLVFGLVFGPIFGLISGLLTRPPTGLLVGLIFGLASGLLVGLVGGLAPFIEHFTLRLWLWYTKCLPWNVIAFLDEAAGRLLLHKIGGSYIFVHRLLLDYFATIDDPLPSDSTSSERKK